jgi:hypothetical protein
MNIRIGHKGERENKERNIKIKKLAWHHCAAFLAWILDSPKSISFCQ